MERKLPPAGGRGSQLIPNAKKEVPRKPLTKKIAAQSLPLRVQESLESRKRGHSRGQPTGKEVKKLKNEGQQGPSTSRQLGPWSVSAGSLI